jgi:DNA-binding transcriptional LysR family regulator
VILPDATTSTRYTLYDQPLLTKAFKAAGIKADIQNAQGSNSKFSQIADSMISEGVKVLVIDPPDRPLPSGYTRTELTEDPFVAIVPRGHPLADAGTIALTDLRGETWVSNDYPRSPGHRLVVASCSAAGFRPRFSVQAQDHYTAIGFVAAGIGVSVLPGLAARSLPATVVRLGIAAPTPVRHLAAVVHDLGAPNPPAVRAVSLLKELIAHPSSSPRRPAGRR